MRGIHLADAGHDLAARYASGAARSGPAWLPDT
jgi:hypothetical protein